MVEAPVRRHEVCDHLCVVDSGQQVERSPDGQRREELRELCGRLDWNDNVIGPVEQSERRNSGKRENEKTMTIKCYLSAPLDTF